MSEEQEPKQPHLDGPRLSASEEPEPIQTKEKERTTPNGEDIRSRWFPRDGEPVQHQIPEHVREQIIKERERSSSEPYIRFRVVGVRGNEFMLEFPDYPDVRTVWIDLAARADGHRGVQGGLEFSNNPDEGAVWIDLGGKSPGRQVVRPARNATQHLPWRHAALSQPRHPEKDVVVDSSPLYES